MNLPAKQDASENTGVTTPERHGLAWNEDEESKLYDAFVAGISVDEIAASHQRKPGGIRGRLNQLGLIDDEGFTVSPRPEFAPTPAAQRRTLKAAALAEQKSAAKTSLPPAPELNERFSDALHIMADTKASAFITGKAGSGKSTLLTWFSRNTDKNVVILAPTGVAALNVGGQTIHSFFHFNIDVTPQKIRDKKKPRNAKLYKRLQMLIIDEVSMVRADLLDCVETFLRMHGPEPGEPFGGVQMIFIGDLYQLPPVVTSQEEEIFRGLYETPYFFSAHAMQNFPLEIVELEKVYRQKDPEFVDLLNRVRNNSVTAQDIAHLNSRFTDGKAAPEHSFTITLTATNKRADDINFENLAALRGQLHQSAAKIEGDFGREYFPTATDLSFKTGAQIMMLNNDTEGRWVNGTLGIIEDVKQSSGEEYLRVRLHDRNEVVDVTRHMWEVYRFKLADNQIFSEPAGTFTQYPFRLAWAVTIHKSQGKTFEHVTIDVGAGTFAAGQMYVALSRCTSFEGIVLKTPIKPHYIRTDPRIVSFMDTQRYRTTAIAAPAKDSKLALIETAIREQALLDIVYLKDGDTQTARTVRPLTLGNATYQGKAYMGMKAFCTELNAERVFSVDRIVEIRKAGT